MKKATTRTAVNRHMHLTQVFVSEILASRVALVMERRIPGVIVDVIERAYSATGHLNGTYDLRVERKSGNKPFAQYEVQNILALADGARLMAAVTEYPHVANVVFDEGPRSASFDERVIALTTALIASGADVAFITPAGTNYSGRRMYVANGTIKSELGLAYARLVINEAAARVLMNTESLSVRETPNAEVASASGGLHFNEDTNVTTFTGVVFY